MLLSKLAYNVIKNVNYLDDGSFTYSQYLKKSFIGDPDHATDIVNVFNPINLAIARLNDNEKIPYRIDSLNSDNNKLDLTKLPYPVKEVIGIAQMQDGDYKKLDCRAFNNQILITGPYNRNEPVYIEYKIDIPYFDDDSFNYEYGNDDELISDKDVDLREYGITDSMANYIIQYACSRLQESSAPDLAIHHLNLAETYFTALAPIYPSFSQRVVHKKYGIE